ncbi:MAG: transporter substrate-binding protein [Hyphomicrobiales bacterium]|nr:transporter substrate-binding protein [Hyphomicrobiales bacterium]
MASRYKTSIPALFLLGLGVLASACGAASAQQTKVRFASVGGITDAPLYLAEEFGLFKEAGLSVEMMRMASATSLMTAVATNQLDAAGISITPGLYSSVKQGMNMRIVGDKQSLRPGFSATRLLIRADLSQGNEAADMKALKGKKIAVSAKASSVYMLLEKLLKKHGMSLSDVSVVELAYPNILPAFTTKAIDAAIDLEPFMSQALQAGAAKVTSDLTEFVPPAGATIVPIVYSEDFVARAPAAKAFMKAYMQGVRIYNDAFAKGRDKEKIIEIIARYAKVKPEIVSDGFPAGLDPDQAVSASFLDELQDFFVEQKFLREKIDVRRIVDTSFAEAAVHDLGAYK